jgi:bisphosphoglycerate-dependent phosphoglycerate mutase
MNNTQMTLTERNERLYELRQKLNKARAEVAWIEQEIWLVRDQYDRQGRDIYQEMFGEKNTLWDHLDRMSDTPMAEEIYGG